MHTIHKTYRILILLVAFNLAACTDDFLDLSPQQSVLTSEYLQSYDDFRAAIVGAYDQLQDPDWYGRYMVLVPDIMGEDVKQNASANRAKDWAEYSGNSADGIAESIWTEIYEGVNMVNRIINSEFSPASTVQADFNQIVGEAHAIRALAYFDLVRMFAQTYTFTADASHPGVPLVTESDPEGEPSRNSVAEVYGQIVADLEQAISLMTISPDNTGRFSKEAAQALLSRVYLYMENWEMVVQQSTAVIESGQFSLVPNEGYQAMFAEDFSSESILEVVMTLTDNNGSDALGGMYVAAGYGDYLPSENYFSLLPEGDVRGTLFAPDSANLGGIYGFVRVNKYPSSGSAIGTDNTKILRLSEIYLNRAEANAQLGNFAEAQADLNLIRQRGFPEATAVTATGQALVDAILIERRKELAFEGHRIFDITRNQQNLVRDDCTSVTCEVPYPSDRFILPIPLVELNANAGLEGQQNPGYGI